MLNHHGQAETHNRFKSDLHFLIFPRQSEFVAPEPILLHLLLQQAPKSPQRDQPEPVWYLCLSLPGNTVHTPVTENIVGFQMSALSRTNHFTHSTSSTTSQCNSKYLYCIYTYEICLQWFTFSMKCLMNTDEKNTFWQNLWKCHLSQELSWQLLLGRNKPLCTECTVYESLLMFKSKIWI